MVMCCSQWMLIMHANEHGRAEEEGGEDDGDQSEEVLFLILQHEWKVNINQSCHSFFQNKP